ncbi:MAG: cadmium-translocating P-type ATPase [Armatimonadetes bacterium]|nr:MAG: cadmium-translocating P-type ATPase [Armatimonadota bacterium]
MKTPTVQPPPVPAAQAASASLSGASAEQTRDPRTRIEPVLTGITFLSLVCAWILGQGPLALACLLVAYVAGSYYGVVDTIAAARERRIDVNLLMIVAALGAAAVGEAIEGATLLFLFSLSNTLQQFALNRSRRAVRELMKLQPEVATRVGPEGLEVVSVSDLVVGDHIRVVPGDRIPADGRVVSGSSHVDESAMTGESLPVRKEPGDETFAGTVNGDGSLVIEVTRPQKETLLARVLQLVEEAQASKGRTQRYLERFEQWYAIVVLLISALTGLGLFLSGWAWGEAFYRAMTLLVVASPCALVISTPATMLSAIAAGARSGALFKGGDPVEQLASVKAIAFDKTGTLTEGKLAVRGLHLLRADEEGAVWQRIASAQALSEHPIAKAIAEAAAARGVQPLPLEEFRAVSGQGVVAIQDGVEIRIGNERLFEGLDWVPTVLEKIEEYRGQGLTSVVVAFDSEPAAIVTVADSVRPSARPAIEQLHREFGVPCALITGDARAVAESVAADVEIDEVYAALLPDEKLQPLRDLHERYGSVAMVGDGINDAPALATADVGIAMGAGTDVALETADVVLVGNDLTSVPYAVGLARRARKILIQNIAFASAVVVALVILTFAENLRLPTAVVGHEGSTVLVVLNGLRLLAYQKRT